MHNKNNNIQREEISAQLLTLRLLLTSREDQRNSLDEKKEDEELSKKKKTMLCYDGYHQFDGGIGRGFGGAMYMLQRQEKTVGAKGCKSVKYNKILWKIMEKKKREKQFVYSKWW